MSLADESVRITCDGAAAVDHSYYWRPINQLTPRGTKVQLINRADGVAQYGHYSPKDTHWTHWAPLPKFKDRP